MLLKAMLEGKGIKVDTCANGKDALMRLEESGLDRYDVLWTDLKMPNIGGAELSQAFRSRGFKKFIVVLTGNMSDDSRVLCDKADVDLICLKPLRKKDLYDLPIMQLYK
jgi:CheY-like chemotaxis protein